MATTTPRALLPASAALALLLAPGAGRAQSPFYPGPDFFACPGRPVALAAADFDADRIADIVAAAAGSGSIVFLAGEGNGKLRPARAFVVGGQPVDLAAVDLDRDGSPDVVWVDIQDGSVAWMLGTPDGAQLFSPVHSLPGEDEATSLAVVDLEPDGWPDVVTANQGADVLTVYRNVGGSLELQGTLAVGDAPSVVRAAWWPGAAAPNLLVAETGALSDDVGVYAGPQHQLVQVLPAPGLTDIRVDDWNGDPWPDLLAREARSGAVSVWAGAADGSLALALRIPVPAGAGVVARLPGGGTARRLITTDEAHNRVSFYRGPIAGPLGLVDAYFVGGDLRGILVFDLDGDQVPEVLAALGDEDGIAVLRRTAAGLQAYPSALTGGIPTGLDLLPADGDRPCRLAVLCAESNDVRICDLVGARWHEIGAVAAPPASTRVAWIRLDNDPLPDLLVFKRDAELRIIPAAAGGWAPAIVLPLASTVRDAAAGDLDGDGDVDLVLADAQLVALRVLLGDGAGGFVDGEVLPLQGAPELCGVHDLDLDGRADVLALDAFRSLYIAFSNPGGLSAPLRFDVGEEPRGLAFGNLNGDGIPDVVCANSGEGTFTSIISTAPRTYALGARHVVTPVGAAALCVLDADGNGLDDVAVSGPSAHEVSLHLNGGENDFSVPITFRCTSLALGLAGDDFDGDGRDDLVVLDGLGNALVSLLSSTSPEVVAPSFALTARRIAAGVELVAQAPASARALRARDGAAIPLQPVGGAVEPAGGSRWVGLDATASAGPEQYVLLDERGAQVARAGVEALPRAVGGGAQLLMLAPAPNPSDGAVTLRVRSATRAPELTVHDVRGRCVARLQLQREDAQWYTARWDGRDARGLPVGAGRYFAVARAGGHAASVPLMRRRP